MCLKQKEEQIREARAFNEYMIKNGKELSDRLYRAIEDTVVITLDGCGSHEYQYELKGYNISIPCSWLTLHLKRKDDIYTISKKISKIEISNESKVETNICSKVHLTLDGHMTRIYINWDENVNVPEDNEYFEETDEKPYDKFTGLKYTMEHCKYWNRKQSVIKEKYFIDKKETKCGLILHEGENGSGRLCVFVEGFNYESGFINYQIINNNGKKCIEIIDTVQKNKRRGHGKQAMVFLIEYAQIIDALYLFGEMSSVDEKAESNKEWRNGFYKSLGFEISGNIIKKII